MSTSVIDVSEFGNSSFAAHGSQISSHVESLTAAIASHQHNLYRIAFRMLRNAQDAQDALQDALLLAFRNLSQFKGQARMTTWLTAIVMNSARMLIRRRCSRGTLSLHQMDGERTIDAADFFVDSRPGPEELYGRAELRWKLENATERLSPKTRSVFRLVVLKGFSIREAAQTLGVTEGAVKARLFHGRNRVLDNLCGSEATRRRRKSLSALSQQPTAARRSMLQTRPPIPSA
jgi:RNA polymerase sigma-70 factor, ECF subfamily